MYIPGLLNGSTALQLYSSTGDGLSQDEKIQMSQKASPVLLGEASRSNGDQESDNYRYTQSELLRSTPILALALGGPGMD